MISGKYLTMCHVIEQVAVMIYHNQWGRFCLPKMLLATLYIVHYFYISLILLSLLTVL